MNLYLTSSSTHLNSEINITGSKSESNRLLLLQALYPQIAIENLSNSDDSEVMEKGLKIEKGTVDIHHAGTAMRFLTSFFACSEGREVVLTGSQRMKQRPVAILVDALRQLDASVEYLENDGYPPLKIVGKNIEKNKVTMAADVSSQYISSLLLVASSLKNGLELILEGKITSVPYIKMTLALLNQIGIRTAFEGNVIRVEPAETVIPETSITVESDWSSASYFYSIVALCDQGTEIQLSSYMKDSLQGDSVLAELYKEFGVSTTFLSNSILLRKEREVTGITVNFDLSNAPDIAQTIAVSCFGMGLGCELSGLHTLKIKETDRLEALRTELGKLGADISVTNRELSLRPASVMNKGIAIDTYNDHRMAMAFAPLALKVPLIINDAEVVSKSYPGFWDDMRSLKFEVSEL